MSQTIIDLGHNYAMLVKTCIKIKALSEDLFCTGDIDIDIVQVYRQFLNHEPPWFFHIWWTGNRAGITKYKKWTV